MSHQKGNWEWLESCREDDFVNCAFPLEGSCLTHMPHKRPVKRVEREREEDL